MKKKYLRTKLLYIAGAWMLGIFVVVNIAVHLIVTDYTRRITKKSMDEEFNSRVISEEKEILELESKIENEVFFPVYVFVTFSDESGMHLVGDWYREKERYTAQEILKQEEGTDKAEPKKSFSVKIQDKTYFVEKRTYIGKFDGYFIDPESPSAEKREYKLYVYVNTTSIERMVSTVNQWIRILFGVFGSLMFFVILWELRKISDAFSIFNRYLVTIGKREKEVISPKIEYKEFDEAVRTVEHMDALIDASEESGKKFFQNASHELRTPLMSIQGYAEGISEGIIDQKEGLHVIRTQSDKMAKLVNQILFLSKFENEDLNRENTDIVSLLYACADRIYTIDKKQIEFCWDMPKKLLFYCDEDLMEKVFENLLSNAYRYAKSRIDIQVRQEEKQLTVSIADDGQGIHSKDLPYIFERFYKGEGGNFGIGLSLVQEIVKKHQGQIKVDSKPGETKFILTFPF